jgi:enamine deaminase RidA (YjgF/YER057c/UK114 family)
MAGDPTDPDETGHDAGNQRLVDDFMQAVAGEGEVELRCSSERALKAQEMVAAIWAAGLEGRRLPLPLVERAHPLLPRAVVASASTNRAVTPPTTADPAATANDGVARYVPAVEVPAGSRTLHISGQVGIDRHGKLAKGAEAQLELAYSNLTAVLAEAGMGWGDAVKSTIMLTDEAQIPAWRAARDRAMDGSKCAATLMIVEALAAPGIQVEIELIAAKRDA